MSNTSLECHLENILCRYLPCKTYYGYNVCVSDDNTYNTTDFEVMVKIID